MGLHMFNLINNNMCVGTVGQKEVTKFLSVRHLKYNFVIRTRRRKDYFDL